MPYVTLRHGLICSRKLEYNVVDHCNLSCNECSHYSPYMSAASIPIDTFRSDIKRLATVYRVNRFRFVGGEPLLHKGILEYVNVVRESGIGDCIEIATNGVLLDRVPDELFAHVDRISVSWYPDSRAKDEVLKFAARRCRRYSTELRVERISQFRRMQVAGPIANQKLVKDIYRSCMIAHTWSCQTFYDGRFYLCSRPIFLAAYLQRVGAASLEFHKVDGIPLHKPDLKRRIANALSSEEPLAACTHCLGTVGRYVAWKQMGSRSRWNPSPPQSLRHGDISVSRMKYLLAWRTVETALLRRFPSAKLAEWMSALQTASLGD